MHNFGIDGDSKIVIMENNKTRVLKVRTLFHKLGGRKASHRSMDEVCALQPSSNILIQCEKDNISTFNSIKWGLCSQRAICKLKGDRISLSASYDTFLYDQKLGWVDLENIYPKSNMIKYLNLKNEYVYDWITSISMPQSDIRFVYSFYTECNNFIANRLVIQSAV